MKTEKISYQDGEKNFEGYYAYDDKHAHKRPLVLICHDYTGKNKFVEQKAEKIAALGYVGFAVDLYGDGKLGKTKEEKTALMNPLLENRDLILSRLNAALVAAKKIDVVDQSKIAIMGFCFGGLCGLDFARFTQNVIGAVSFHGALKPRADKTAELINSKILVLHGYADPMVKPNDVLTFADEMTKAKADWQIHMYGNTMHAFTNPEANDPDFGTVYHQSADKRSWQAMVNFFDEIFGKC